MAAKRKNNSYIGTGNGTDNAETARFTPEPAAMHVAAYAEKRLRIMFDSRLPALSLDSSLGAECKKAIDAAAELQRVCALLCGGPSDAIRDIARQLLGIALDPTKRTGAFDALGANKPTVSDLHEKVKR